MSHKPIRHNWDSTHDIQSITFPPRRTRADGELFVLRAPLCDTDVLLLQVRSNTAQSKANRGLLFNKCYWKFSGFKS